MSEAFTTIVADPAWPYRDALTMSKTKRGAATNYPTMSIEAIRALATPDRRDGRGRSISPATLAGHQIAPNAHLYLWTTNAFMGEAHDVARAWGFLPRTILTWVKPRIGMGFYFRNTTEHVIFAVRGKLRTRRKNQRTDFAAPVGAHSAKPAIFYEIVESMSPGPYLELFARERRAGWTSWGNELGLIAPATPLDEPPLPFDNDAHPETLVEWS